MKAVLQDILPQRDLLTAGLAEGQPTIRPTIEETLNSCMKVPDCTELKPDGDVQSL